MYPEISEDERFPIISPQGRQLLHRMRQHPYAPVWNWPNGEQLDHAGLESVRDFAEALNRDRSPQTERAPDWVADFVDFCLAEVPFYRRGNSPGTRFHEIPSCSRADLAPKVWEFVPDRESLEQLIVFSSSGTTGHPSRMPSHPATAACGIPMIEYALSRYGIAFPRGSDSVGLTNIASYRDAFTTAIVVSYLQESGCVRVNLHPTAWRSPKDCEKYLNEWRSPIWLGDPIAFADLEKIDLSEPPKAIVSSIMRLSDGLADHLTRRFGCPVLDLYALTEAGIIALRTDRGHEVLPHDVYVEILDEHDAPCRTGTRGEITITSGRNPYMPLLRYRTGDFASLEHRDGKVFLIGLEGRIPVEFPLPSGRIVHSMEVTRLMRQHPLLQYHLHQDATGRFQFAYRGNIDERALTQQLFSLLENPENLTIRQFTATNASARKIPEYESEFKTRGS